MNPYIRVTFQRIDRNPSIESAIHRWVARFEAALAEFYAGRFGASQRAFQAVLAERQDDPPSVRYLARLQEICQGPHPPNFDGVLTLTEK